MGYVSKGIIPGDWLLISHCLMFGAFVPQESTQDFTKFHAQKPLYTHRGSPWPCYHLEPHRPLGNILIFVNFSDSDAAWCAEHSSKSRCHSYPETRVGVSQHSISMGSTSAGSTNCRWKIFEKGFVCLSCNCPSNNTVQLYTRCWHCIRHCTTSRDDLKHERRCM